MKFWECFLPFNSESFVFFSLL